ncbi:unnamed protein product [Ambrosiozyma monospora]|uniref:Unnamed protein product n=1 Tax=Ambrosiozyma monospora TaxID=43982 RepID=A0ACB5T141_AMBMO|nr:unnamed protein product [Ambrosiozyma monospora]
MKDPDEEDDGDSVQDQDPEKEDESVIDHGNEGSFAPEEEKVEEESIQDRNNENHNFQETTSGTQAFSLELGETTTRPSTSESIFTGDITQTTGTGSETLSNGTRTRTEPGPVAVIRAGEDVHLATVEIWEYDVFIDSFSLDLRFKERWSEEVHLNQVVVKSYSTAGIKKAVEKRNYNSNINRAVVQYQHEVKAYERIEAYNASHSDEIVNMP